MVLPVKCEYPVYILDQKAKAIFLKQRSFFSATGALVRVLEADSHDERTMLRYVYNHKPKTSLEYDKCPYVLTSFGEYLPLFRLVACGKCSLCKEKKSNDWSSRVSLECEAHEHLPLMVTLTYNNEHLPLAGVMKTEVQKFLKRLRVNLARNGYDDKFRYILCSEYGSKRGRPHYHLLIFGLDSRLYYFNKYQQRNAPTKDLSWLFYISWGIVHRATSTSIKWCESFGYTYLMFCDNTKAGRYVCKYMRKGCQQPIGQNKTFFLSSRRGGAIGWLGFVYHGLDKALIDNPSSPSLQYIPRHGDGTAQNCVVPYYFLQKCLPSFSQVFPATLRRKWQFYTDSLNHLRERPRLACLADFKQRYGVSILDSALQPCKSILDRFECSSISSRQRMLSEYGYFKASEYELKRFEELLPELANAQSPLDSMPYVFECERKRALYLSTRPKQMYDITAELQRCESATSKLFDRVGDGQ